MIPLALILFFEYSAYDDEDDDDGVDGNDDYF